MVNDEEQQAIETMEGEARVEAGPSEEGSDPAADPAPLKERIERLEAELAEARRENLSLFAEVENIRKRAQRDIENASRYGLERLVENLLPVKDNLDRAIDAAKGSSDFNSLQIGVEMTANLFKENLENLGVKEITPLGERFSPDFHQAIGMEESADYPPGTISRVVQKGYSLHNRLLRPAMVMVVKESSA